MLKYKNYKLIKPSLIVNKRINYLIDRWNGSIFHEPDLNHIIEKKFNTKLFYLVDNPERISHAAVVHVLKEKYGRVRYNLRPLYDIPYSGFIGDTLVDFLSFSIGVNESISYIGFPYKKKISENSGIKIGQTTMVDLSLSEEEIFLKVINSKRRNMIRKAQKNGVKIRKYTNIEGLQIFWPILKILHQKLGYMFLDFSYYKNIAEKYFNTKKGFILVAFKDNEPISGILLLGNHNFMHYYKGASVSRIKNNGHGELLQWEAIKYSKYMGSKYYDLCNINKAALPSIYKFKTGIANNLFEYPKYSKNSIGYKIASMVSKSI